MAIDRDYVASAALVAGLTFLSFFLFQALGVTAQEIVLQPIGLQGSLLSGGLDVGALIGRIVYDGLRFAFPLVAAVLAFSVLAVFGMSVGDDKRIGPAASAVGSMLGVAYAGVTFTSIAFALGLIAASAFVTGSALRTYQVTTKWKNYESAKRAAGKGFLIVNVALSIGVFLTIFTNAQFYTDLYLKGIQEGVGSLIESELSDAQLVERLPANVREKYDALPPERQKAFLQEYRELIADQTFAPQDSNGIFAKLVTAYLYAAPLVVFGALELLRSFVLSPLAGVAAVPAMRRKQRLGLVRSETIAG